MSFMQPQIYKGGFYEVETTHGTEIVPADLLNDSESVQFADLADYVQGKQYDGLIHEDAPYVRQVGYLARMSAPGYMDCTDWVAFQTEKAAEEYLQEYFGDESEEEDC